ncbi:MAG: helix-turn-helix domain containing protein [Lachnospiraceae bacterium]|nr:helix-turn-helix domain containing protein [Lachnospiraceae bacterium]
MNKELSFTDLPEKVQALFHAVVMLLGEGRNVQTLTVSEITTKAGIGKGTAYEYFSNKEEIIASAICYEAILFMQQLEQEMSTERTFQESLLTCLHYMEARKITTKTLGMYAHIIMVQSSLGDMIKEKMCMLEQYDLVTPKKLLVRYINIAKGKNEIRKDLPESYISAVITMKFIFFIWALTEDETIIKREMDGATREDICGYIIDGIMKELC